MKPLAGRSLAKTVRQAVAADAALYREQAIIPTLAIIVATTEADAWWYVRALEKAAAACSIEILIIELPPEADTEAIAKELEHLANDPAVHGIILQTPLPRGVDSDLLVSLIPPVKDVDGANPLSAGRLQAGLEAFAPATAAAVLALLDEYRIELAGKRAVVIGRSLVVGKPVANLLLARDATVTIGHSKSLELVQVTRSAEILVVAVGRPHLISQSMVSAGTVVIDVGTNPTADGALLGDVAPDVAEIAQLTPVPGGVGPVTTALLLQHVIRAVGLQAA